MPAEIDVTGVDVSALEDVVNYIYTGEFLSHRYAHDLMGWRDVIGHVTTGLQYGISCRW